METKSSGIKTAFFILLALALVILAFAQIPINWPDLTFAILEPKGLIAEKQRWLIIAATLIMLIAVAPTYFFLFYFSKKYKAEKQDVNYSPNLTSNAKSSFFLWAIPVAIIFVISIIIVKSTHELDPYKPIASAKKPLTVQVVSLRWKWLFIYPEQNIATVNFMQIPANTPINFELTSDGPMNTFWIPQLGGQIYTMAAMSTKLHLIANETGNFEGQSSEISGKGYSGMRFKVKATSRGEFDAWVKEVKNSPQMLHKEQYNELLEPSENHEQTNYSMVEKDLFNSIIMKYMSPTEMAK